MPRVWKILIRILILSGLSALVAFALVFVGVKKGWTNTAGVVDSQFQARAPANPSWAAVPEWQTLAAALSKDQVVIGQVARETGIPARLIVAVIVPEQLRLYFSEREIFKEIFSPLKILGNQVQFSWGIAGLKQETAKEIEVRAGTDSPFLAFSSNNPDAERFQRIADEHNHYYSYLYTALFLKEIETEWRQAGYPIDARPEILATLFNIGFEHSKPNAAPRVGGAAIQIGSEEYSFGGLAYEFYYSNELLDFFPR